MKIAKFISLFYDDLINLLNKEESILMIHEKSNYENSIKNIYNFTVVTKEKLIIRMYEFDVTPNSRSWRKTGENSLEGSNK